MDLIFQIVSVEAGKEPLGVDHPQLVQDVSPDPGGGGGREGDEGDPGESLPQHVQLLVVGPEVMAPLGHAVSLVNDKPGQLLAPV